MSKLMALSHMQTCLITEDQDRQYGIMMIIERDSLLKLVMTFKEVNKFMIHMERNVTLGSS